MQKRIGAYCTITDPTIVSECTTQTIWYVPGLGNTTVCEAVFFGAVAIPSAGMLRSCTALLSQANVTEPPGAIFTLAGDQKYRDVPVTPIDALMGFPLAGGGVGVGGTGVGTVVFPAGGLVAVAGAVVGWVVAACVGLASGVALADAVAEGLAVTVPGEDTGVPSPPRVGLAAVVGCVVTPGVGSLESLPPQAAARSPAAAMAVIK